MAAIDVYANRAEKLASSYQAATGIPARVEAPVHGKKTEITLSPGGSPRLATILGAYLGEFIEKSGLTGYEVGYAAHDNQIKVTTRAWLGSEADLAPMFKSFTAAARAQIATLTAADQAKASGLVATGELADGTNVSPKQVRDAQAALAATKIQLG